MVAVNAVANLGVAHRLNYSLKSGWTMYAADNLSGWCVFP